MPEKAKIPVYTNDYQYAQENRDYDEWRASNNANKECSAALDKAINEKYTYENYHLDTNAVINSVYEEFGKERTDYLLAVHIVNHDWDGRFSNGVKEWAKDKFKYLDQNYVRSELREHGLKSHSTLIDGVARTVIQREKELENPTAAKVSVKFHPHRADEFILKEIATGGTLMTGTREDVRRFCEAELAASVKISGSKV